MRPLPLPPPPTPRSTMVAIVALLGLVLTTVVLVCVVPKFEEVFRQVKVPMPGMTLFLMSLSDSILADRWAAALLLVAVPARLSRLTARQESIARVLVPVVIFASAAWMVSALFQPLMCLHHGIGAPR